MYEMIVLFALTNYLNELHRLCSSNPKSFSYFMGSQLPDHSNALCWLLMKISFQLTAGAVWLDTLQHQPVNCSQPARQPRG